MTLVRVVWVYAVAAEAEKLVAPRLGNVGRPDALAEQSPQPVSDLALVETAKNRFGDDPAIRLPPGRDEHLRELYRILDEADAKTDVKVDPRIRDRTCSLPVRDLGSAVLARRALPSFRELPSG